MLKTSFLALYYASRNAQKGYAIPFFPNKEIAQLSSELASAQAKLILSLLDNQRLLKSLSEKDGSWNTSGGVTDGKISRGGAAGPWDGPSIHYCHTHRHKCTHFSFKCPETRTGHIKNATKKDTRGGSDKEYKISDSIIRRVIAKI